MPISRKPKLKQKAPNKMKAAANKANKIRIGLDQLPSGFARTVVADFICGLHPEHKESLLELVKELKDAPPRGRVLIRMDQV